MHAIRCSTCRQWQQRQRQRQRRQLTTGREEGAGAGRGRRRTSHRFWRRTSWRRGGLTRHPTPSTDVVHPSWQASHAWRTLVCTAAGASHRPKPALRLQVILANRSRGKADDLAAAMGGGTSVASPEEVAAGVRQLQAAAVHGGWMLWCTCCKGRCHRCQPGTRAESACQQ